MIYCIAGLFVSINTDERYFLDLLREYEADAQHIDMYVDISIFDEIPIEEGTLLERQNIRVGKVGGITSAYYLHDDKCYGAIKYDTCYEHTELLLVRKPDYDGLTMTDIGYLLLGALFHYRLTFFDGISLHGSAIKYKGNAIIFTAPSGVGKSTQANLWREKFGDQVTFINDDKPPLRMIDGRLMCYGSPFAGKHHINDNDEAPVKAIINVVRAKTNSIERLSIRDSIVVLLEETQRSMLSGEINKNNMRIISDILSAVPVYRLHCTPDMDAVDVTLEVLDI